jgi:hypothetical protein
MRKILFLFLCLITISCAKRQTQDLLRSGNYDEAISLAVEGLKSNKDKKGKQEFIYFLEEAFAKAKERDLREIQLLSKESNPANFEAIYNKYVRLNNRQELIRPLLPLKLIKERRQAIFPFGDYSDEIISSKSALAKHLYENAKQLVASGDKVQARKAFDDLQYLESISPGYKDAAKIRDEARYRGTDFVSVFSKNETQIIIPARLEADLLDFSTFGLNDKWTVYHSNRVKDIQYDYGIVLNFRDIKISPEQVREKEFTVSREISVGKIKLLDRNGQVVNDSLGKPIMVDKIKTVTATVLETRQFKACNVTAKVDYIDFRSNQLMDSHPLVSEFVFENIFSRYKGDKRAIEENYLIFLNRGPVPFPSNEQMVADAGTDIKAKLKAIISRNRIRR